jgi:hypothetical protein
MNIRERISAGVRRTAAIVGVGALIMVGATAAATPASASTGSDYHPLISNSSWLNVGVRGGSTSSGTDIIQWWADGAADQQWRGFQYGGDGSNVVRFQNQGSGLCLTTDGVPGHWVYQEACDAANGRQAWMRTYIWFYSGYTLYNAATGLNLDVQGNSYWGGAEIDVWYPNGQVNQIFSTPGGGALA